MAKSRDDQKPQSSSHLRAIGIACAGVSMIGSIVLGAAIREFFRKPNRVEMPVVAQTNLATPEVKALSAHQGHTQIVPVPSIADAQSDFPKVVDSDPAASSPFAALPSNSGAPTPSQMPSSGAPTTSRSKSAVPSDFAATSNPISNAADAPLLARPGIQALLAKPVPGAEVTADSPLKAGMVLVTERSGNRWRPVTVLDLKENGDVKIHYINWADNWDEVVPRSKLRFPTDLSINEGK